MSKGLKASMNPGQDVDRLKRRIAELVRLLPAHSVPPAMLQELEELEEMLALAQAPREKT